MADGSISGPPAQAALTVAVTTGSDGTTHVVLAGRLDVLEAVMVRERFARPELAGAQHLVIDLSDVSFVDSAGLAVLARARRDRSLTGGSVILVRPHSEAAMRVFRLTQFDEIFTMVDPPDIGVS